MHEELPPMTDSDLQAFLSLAGPMYAETRAVEEMISENPIHGSHARDGSEKIRQGLEQAERLVRSQAPVSVPHIPQEYIPTPIYQQPSPPVQYAAPPIGVAYNSPPVDNNQLEFQFHDPTALEITNKHLQDISIMLKKILNVLVEQNKPVPVLGVQKSVQGKTKD